MSPKIVFILTAFLCLRVSLSWANLKATTTSPHLVSPIEDFKSVTAIGVGISEEHAVENAQIQALDHQIQANIITQNKAVLSSQVERLSNGHITNQEILEKKVLSNGWYWVKLRIKVRRSTSSVESQFMMDQKRLNRPAVYLNLEGLRFDLTRQMEGNSLKSRLESEFLKIGLSRWYRLHARNNQAQYTLNLKGRIYIRQGSKSCGQGVLSYPCQKLSIEVYPQLLDLRSQEIIFQDSMIISSTVAYPFDPAANEDLFSPLIHHSKGLLDRLLKRQIQVKNNFNLVSLTLKHGSYDHLLALKIQLQKLYRFRSVKSRYDNHPRLEIPTNLDASDLAEAIAPTVSELGLRVTSLGKNHLEISN